MGPLAADHTFHARHFLQFHSGWKLASEQYTSVVPCMCVMSAYELRPGLKHMQNVWVMKEGKHGHQSAV